MPKKMPTLKLIELVNGELVLVLTDNSVLKIPLRIGMTLREAYQSLLKGLVK